MSSGRGRMKSLRTIAGTTLFFGLVGPMAGGLILLVPPEFGFIQGVVASYIMGGIPALLAGIAYGAVRVRTNDSLTRWYLRALWGSIAGVLSSSLFCLGVFLSGTMPPGYGFSLTFTVLGALAGALCAVLLRPKKAHPCSPGLGDETPQSRTSAVPPGTCSSPNASPGTRVR